MGTGDVAQNGTVRKRGIRGGGRSQLEIETVGFGMGAVHRGSDLSGLRKYCEDPQERVARPRGKRRPAGLEDDKNKKTGSGEAGAAG